MEPTRSPLRARLALVLFALPLAMNLIIGVFIAATVPRAVGLATETDSQRVLDALATEERLVGALLSGFSALGLAAAWAHDRRPDAATAAALLLAVATWAAVTGAMAFSGGSLTLFYGVQTGVAGVGAALAIAWRRAG